MFGTHPAYTYRDQLALKRAKFAVPTITAKVPVKRKSNRQKTSHGVVY